MFPTHVGMNRWRLSHHRPEKHVPHTRGDEPDYYNNYLAEP